MQLILLVLPFNGRFPVNWVSLHLLQNAPLRINGMGFLQARYPSCHQTITDKGTEGKQITKH